MTQPRIFVTYMPAPRRGARTAPRKLRQAGPPAMAVLASAVLAGGSIMGFGGTQSNAAQVGGSREPAPPLRLGQAGTRPLPYLAVASVSFEAPRQLAPRVEAEPRETKRPAPPAPVPATARPRRDLAGFLADRGLTLAPAMSPVEVGIAGGEISADPPPDAPALAVLAPIEAVPSPEPGAGAEVETQSYPTVAVGGEELGAVTMRGGKIHLASLVGLLKLKLPSAEFDRLSTSSAADSFVDFEMLREAGMTMTLDPGGDRVTLSVL